MTFKMKTICGLCACGGRWVSGGRVKGASRLRNSFVMFCAAVSVAAATQAHGLAVASRSCLWECF